MAVAVLSENLEKLSAGRSIDLLVWHSQTIDLYGTTKARARARVSASVRCMGRTIHALL